MSVSSDESATGAESYNQPSPIWVETDIFPNQRILPTYRPFRLLRDEQYYVGEILHQMEYYRKLKVDVRRLLTDYTRQKNYYASIHVNLRGSAAHESHINLDLILATFLRSRGTVEDLTFVDEVKELDRQVGSAHRLEAALPRIRDESWRSEGARMGGIRIRFESAIKLDKLRQWHAHFYERRIGFGSGTTPWIYCHLCEDMKRTKWEDMKRTKGEDGEIGSIMSCGYIEPCEKIDPSVDDWVSRAWRPSSQESSLPTPIELDDPMDLDEVPAFKFQEIMLDLDLDKEFDEFDKRSKGVSDTNSEASMAAAISINAAIESQESGNGSSIFGNIKELQTRRRSTEGSMEAVVCVNAVEEPQESGTSLSIFPEDYTGSIFG